MEITVEISKELEAALSEASAALAAVEDFENSLIIDEFIEQINNQK